MFIILANSTDPGDGHPLATEANSHSAGAQDGARGEFLLEIESALLVPFRLIQIGSVSLRCQSDDSQAGDGRDFICGPDGTLRKVLLHGGPELYESLAEAALKVHCVTAPRLL